MGCHSPGAVQSNRTPESWGRSQIWNLGILGDFYLQGQISEAQKSGHFDRKMCSKIQQNQDISRGFGCWSAPNQHLSAEFGSMKVLSHLEARSKLDPSLDKCWSVGRGESEHDHPDRDPASRPNFRGPSQI